jgi:pyruvate-ferredoxin/flavodoxin oxidoreductase
MKPADHEIEMESENWEFSLTATAKDGLMDVTTLKGSQFVRPLMEFNGACPGCGETPYVKLVTQLFGDRMLIANATGCTSIWGGSHPSIAYTTNAKGKGPAWANSLFEDNAEYGYGMFLGVRQLREKLYDLMAEAIKTDIHKDIKGAFKDWMDSWNDGENSRTISERVLNALKDHKPGSDKLIDEILSKKDYLVKQSQWMIGGDGWAYDIGYGGVDQVIAMGDDVNILVLDTEIYSNTGGQSSKSTPTGAVAKFAAGGKKIQKKDLGLMAMSYGYVYVAQIAMGANMNQTIKAISEAEKYKGPSLIIAYSPCVSH